MEDYWNTSNTTPQTLNSFFDEESEVAWTGLSESEESFNKETNKFTKTEKEDKYLESPSGSTLTVVQYNNPNKSANVTSILDNISISPDSEIQGDGKNKSRGIKALGNKIESWKPPSVSLKWKQSDSAQCLQCMSKNEEINQLKSKLENDYLVHNVMRLPEDTVNRMVLGLAYSLEVYTKLDDKLKLLDSALSSFDTSTIVAIVLFMKNSLKRNLFYKELEKRPQASQSYLNYLKARNETSESIDLLSRLGRREEALLLKYQIAIQPKDTNTVLKNLNKLLQSEPNIQTAEAKIIKKHKELLEMQIPIDSHDETNTNNAMLSSYPRATSLLNLPLLTTLYYCSMYHWSASGNDTKSPLYLKKHFSITDKQFLWAIIRARAKVKHWPLPADLENLLTAKGIFNTISNFSGLTSAKKIIKNSLPIDRVVETLHSTGAPSNVLASYISLLDSNEAKLKSALACDCHTIVIEVYVQQKDQESLKNYIQKLTTGSADYIKGQHALINTRW